MVGQRCGQNVTQVGGVDKLELIIGRIGQSEDTDDRGEAGSEAVTADSHGRVHAAHDLDVL